MSLNKKSSFFYAILLKVGLVFFMSGIAYTLFISADEVTNFEVFIKILIVILFIGLSLFSIAMPKKYFNIFNFFIIFIASVFKIITLLSKETIDIEIVSVYFLLITLSLFLLTKVSGHTHRSKTIITH